MKGKIRNKIKKLIENRIDIRQVMLMSLWDDKIFFVLFYFYINFLRYEVILTSLRKLQLLSTLEIVLGINILMWI